jgi:tetratricopeptide (TPR) repeat protein
MPAGRAGPPVARYLRPEEKVVPFRARPELEELLSWCATGGHAAVRLVTGDGGAGKTRLALRLGDKLAANGWQPLWVPRGAERDGVPAVRVLGQPCMLVVDYAETRSELAGLLDDAAADQDGPDLRVLLLARSAGEWWQQLLASAEEQAAALLEASLPVTLGPVRATGGPQEVFADALTAFARELGVGRPAATLTLADPDPVVLVVHAAALLAVIDHATGARPQQEAGSGPEVLDGLLGHEARYWARTAAGRGLNLDLSVLRLAVAVGCLIGADSETSAAALLSRVPDLDSGERRGQVARWLHDLYPAAHDDDVPEQEWLGPLRPDRLAEQLVAGELARRPDLIPRLFTGLGAARATRALTVLARAALTQDSARGLLERALSSDLDHLAVPALSVAVETNPLTGDLLSHALGGQPVSSETLIQVAAASPYPSFALAAPAAVVLRRLAEESADDSERAGRLVDLSNRLADLGRREEALAAIEQAVTIRRQLAEARPDAFLPNLATALRTLARVLEALGRDSEAMKAQAEANAIRR